MPTEAEYPLLWHVFLGELLNSSQGHTDDFLSP